VSCRTVICIRLPAVGGVPVIGVLEMAGVLSGLGLVFIVMTALRVIPGG
jgi:hypothetical protein